MIVEGRIIQLLLLIVSTLSLYGYTEAIKKGKKITVRDMPALNAIDEAVGRAAEMGRPVHYTPGFSLGGLYNPDMGPGVMAGLVILKKVAESTAKRGTKLIVTLAQSESLPIAEETVNFAYSVMNENVPQDAVRYISQEQYAYALGVLSIFLEERPGANIMMGNFWSEAMQFAEGGSYINAMQIGGTCSASQVPFFVAACDYFLIGEELFAAKSVIDQEPSNLGSLVSSDILRSIVISLILLTWLGGNFNIQWLLDLVGM